MRFFIETPKLTSLDIKSFDTYDEAFEYANEANQFLYGEDYKDELQ